MEAGGAREIAAVVIDDDAIVREWIRQSLEGTEFRLAGEAATAEAGREMLARRRPALLIVDYKLPDQRATDFVRELRREGVSVPVLVITARPEPGLNEAVHDAGGDGVVVKRGDRGVFLNALRAVAAGRPVVDPEHPRRPIGHKELSPRERDILGLVAEGATNAEIAGRLGIGVESVKTFLSRAFSKLQARNRVEAVQRAHDRGLL
jgi:DNA-binding NarL/FixJ family response regulator